MRTDIDITSYKKRLEEEKADLLRDLGAISDQNPRNKEDWQAVGEDLNVGDADRNEQADEIENYRERISITEQFEDSLQAVNGALERIENGTYGICKIAGEPIEKERLDANPSAETCKKHINEE